MNTSLHQASRALGLLGLLMILPAAAQDTPAGTLDKCVDLASDHRIVRTGGSDHFLLRTGADHYKVRLGTGCGSLSVASRITISGEGQSSRLCPVGSSVETDRERCDVQQVVNINEGEFKRMERRRR